MASLASWTIAMQSARQQESKRLTTLSPRLATASPPSLKVSPLLCFAECLLVNNEYSCAADVLPEPYRNDGNYDILHARDTGEKVVMADWNRANRKGSLSLNVHELVDEGEEDPIVLQDYFESVIIPLSKLPDPADVESQHTKEDTPLVTRERR
eukprot:scaffold3296_cov159-Ochromonas_danica.AAC.24